MKKLDTQARLECARAAVAVLRSLQLTDQKIEYNQLARAIGLMEPDERWEVRYRNQVSDILYLVAAVERTAGELGKLEYDRIVTKDGEVGAGYYNHARIVITKEPG